MDTPEASVSGKRNATGRKKRSCNGCATTGPCAPRDGFSGDGPGTEAADGKLPEVRLEDVVISVAPRPKRGTVGPVKLFVGGLSWDTTTEDLTNAFAKFGTIIDATVILDRTTGRSRGFGFVTFEKPPDANEAVKSMNGAELDGRILKVNLAESR